MCLSVAPPAFGGEVGWRTGSVRLPSVSFVVTCAFSHRSYDDPIVHPGHPGMSHQHDFFANRSTTATSTLQSLRAAPTTCTVPGDRAAYWVPTLRQESWAKTVRAYYSAGPVDPADIVSFPAGLKMLGGSASGSVAFSCGLGVDAPGWVSAPVVCPSPMSVRVTFPQCWNGQLGALENATKPVGGRCPAAFSTTLPLLRLLLTTSSPTTSTTFTTSAGSADRLHADYWNAWSPEVLDDLVSVCIRGERTSNREIKKCRTAGTGPRAVGGGETPETNF